MGIQIINSSPLVSDDYIVINNNTAVCQNFIKDLKSKKKRPKKDQFLVKKRPKKDLFKQKKKPKTKKKTKKRPLRCLCCSSHAGATLSREEIRTHHIRDVYRSILSIMLHSTNNIFWICNYYLLYH